MTAQLLSASHCRAETNERRIARLKKRSGRKSCCRPDSWNLLRGLEKDKEQDMTAHEILSAVWSSSSSSAVQKKKETEMNETADDKEEDTLFPPANIWTSGQWKICTR